MDLLMRGKRALVTGATAGLGRAIAIELAAEGVDVAVVGRRPELLDAVAQEARSRGAARQLQICADLSEEGVPDTVASTVQASWGGVDILVNCMGVSRQVALSTPDSEWEAVMTLNWTRHRQLSSLLLPGMQARGWGRIVNVTGKNEASGLNATVVAKAAVNAWSKGLSDLVAADGVTVNCVAPGRLDSEQMRRIYTEDRRKEVENTEIPMRRFGEPEELACLVAFLASARASYITGTLSHVDGGARRYMF